jgi:hypothetical protein
VGLGWPSCKIAQAGVGEQFERSCDLLHRREELGGLADAHAQHFADVFAVVFDFERRGVEAQAVAGLAMHAGGRQEGHFDFDLAIAAAGLAAPAFGVEGEAA